MSNHSSLPLKENINLEAFACGMFTKSLDGTYTWASNTLLKRHRLALDQIVGKKDDILPWAAHARELRLHDQEIIDIKKSRVFRETISRQQKTVLGVCHKSPIFNHNNEIIGTTGLFIDIPRLDSNLESQLSKRELQCLSNLVKGMSALESGHHLKISRRTVEWYLEKIRQKLHCKNQAELVSKYYESLPHFCLAKNQLPFL